MAKTSKTEKKSTAKQTVKKADSQKSKETVFDTNVPILVSIGVTMVPGAETPQFVAFKVTTQGDKVLDIKFEEPCRRWEAFNDLKMLVVKEVQTPLNAE